MFDQVNVDENPAPANLGAGDLASASLLLQRHWMDMQEGGRSLQIEGIHARVRQALSTQVHRGDLLAAVAHLVADRVAGVAIDRLLLTRELLGLWTTARRALPAG